MNSGDSSSAVTSGEALKNARMRAELSQDDVAAKIGTTRQQISRLEQDKRTLTRDWAERLAPILGMSPVELVFPGLYSEMEIELHDMFSALKDDDKKRANDILRAFAQPDS